MSEEVKVTLKVSQNLHASMTPRLIGAIVGKKDTAHTGFDLEREFLKSAGLDVSGAQQADGAGGDAHFTPAFMVSYLAYMATRPDYPKFLAALPVLGRDGTLFDIQTASPAAGHVFAKTGTYAVGDPLNRAMLVTGKGLAGYMTTADGRHLAVAIYVNNVGVSTEPDAVKRIVGQALGEVAAAAYDAPASKADAASVTQAGQMRVNELTPAERAAGWRLLFDGKTLKGWRGLGYDTVPTAHWKVENGAIKKIASGNVPKMPDGQPAHGGDLMTVDTFRDFELAWEWKVTPAANSGVKYNVSESFSLEHASNHAALGFEYQIIDDSLNDDNKIPSHRTGALYDLIPPNAKKTVRPAGEWNASRLVFRGKHGEHWLNGQKVVDFDLGTARLDSLLAKSKYRTIPGFADRRTGHIILQDHGDEVYFRGIKIREFR